MRTKHFVAVAVLVWSLLSGVLPVVQARPAQLDDLDKIISDLIALYNVPGVSLALVKDGEVFYTKGYGKANTASGVAVTENTVFQIGSITKSMTVAAMMQLVEQGKVDLDMPIAFYLPDLKLSSPDAARQITVRQIISQTSGLPRQDMGWHGGLLETRQQVLDDLPNIPLTAAPGQVWQYSNQNYVIAGAIIERVSGETWEEYVRQHLFEPLGMNSASFNVDGIKAVADHAEPHSEDILKGLQPIPFFSNIDAVGPAGSVNANALDMAQYIRFQLYTSGKTLLSAQSIKLMHTSVIDMGTNPEGQALKLFSLATDQHYALGWISEKYRGLELVQHDGGIDGFSSTITLVPARNIGVYIAVNAEATAFLEALRLTLVEYLTGMTSTPSVAETLNLRLRTSEYPQLRILDPITRRADWDKARRYTANPDDLEKLVGKYTTSAGGGDVIVELRDGVLYTIFQGLPLQLVPYEAGKFLANSPMVTGAHFEFKTQNDGTTVMYLEGIEVARRA